MNFQAVKPGIWIAYATVLCVLLIGSGTTRVLINRYPERDYTELRLRVRTWWMIVPPVAIALLSGKIASILLLAMMSGVALREYLAMVGKGHAECRGLWFVFLAIPLQYWFAYRASYVAFAACIPVFGLATLPLVMALTRQTDGFLRVAAAANLGLLLTVFSLSHIALLLQLPDASNAQGGAIGWVVFLLLITQLNDVAQYVFGKTFGRRPIAPRLSPKKTVEGFAGGVAVSSVTAAWIGPLLTPMDPVMGAVVGAALAAVGFGGDMAVSAIKRDSRVKDTGNFLPGHGGILDRVDSLIAAAPLFFYFVYFMYCAD